MLAELRAGPLALDIQGNDLAFYYFALALFLVSVAAMGALLGSPFGRTLLAIRENDHFLIQGIVFMVIVALGLATLLLDLIYPLLDPRITYKRT